MIVCIPVVPLLTVSAAGFDAKRSVWYMSFKILLESMDEEDILFRLDTVEGRAVDRVSRAGHQYHVSGTHRP